MVSRIRFNGLRPDPQGSLFVSVWLKVEAAISVEILKIYQDADEALIFAISR
jgi:hypothetical protein